MARVAPHYASLLKDLVGVGRLRDVDAIRTLPDLDPEIVPEQTQIAHAKRILHLTFESQDLTFIQAGDDEIVDVHPHEQASRTLPARVDRVLRVTPGEPECLERRVELGVPRPRRLP